jgi:mono/diheme cytochrome c family protein
VTPAAVIAADEETSRAHCSCKIIQPPPGRSGIRQGARRSCLVRCAPVTRRKRTLALGLIAVAGLAACGKSIEVPKTQTRLYQGALLFNLRCSGCHTLDAAATSGSKSKREIKGGERTNGPNFNVRHEDKQDILFAIRNGGFSGAIMPANIVVGDDAQKVAEFLAKYAGKGGESSSPSSGQSGSASGSP